MRNGTLFYNTIRKIMAEKPKVTHQKNPSSAKLLYLTTKLIWERKKMIIVDKYR